MFSISLEFFLYYINRPDKEISNNFPQVRFTGARVVAFSVPVATVGKIQTTYDSFSGIFKAGWQARSPGNSWGQQQGLCPAADMDYTTGL